MKHTKNQHVLSQWWLRNFRSDDTATSPNEKKRVWYHTVYIGDTDNNVIKDIPLRISSVAIKKDCFTLIDVENDEKFDIENELILYENRSVKLVRELVQGHSFEKLLDINCKKKPLDTILNLMVIQMVLNLSNPQNMYEGKDYCQREILKPLIDNFDNFKSAFNNPPSEMLEAFQLDIYKKIVRVINSKSPKEDICKALSVLLMILESEELPTVHSFLSNMKDKLFKDLYIEGIYHTGYTFDSTEPRPVFCLAPNIMAIDIKRKTIYLPLSHNLSIRFSIGRNTYYNNTIDVFTTNPSVLKIKSDKIKVFKVSHDYIDNISSNISVLNNALSNTIYTPHCEKDILSYLKIKADNPDHFHTPKEPEFVTQNAEQAIK